MWHLRKRFRGGVPEGPWAGGSPLPTGTQGRIPESSEWRLALPLHPPPMPLRPRVGALPHFPVSSS